MRPPSLRCVPPAPSEARFFHPHRSRPRRPHAVLFPHRRPPPRGPGCSVAAARRGLGAVRLARTAGDPGGAVFRRGADRRGGAHAGHSHGQDAGAAAGGREHRGRRRHHRPGARGQGPAQRLHHPDPPHGHGDRAGAVQEAALRPAEGLRVHRPGHGRADDASLAQGLPGQHLPRAAGLCEAAQGQGHAGQRRHRRGLAALRHAAGTPDRRGPHHRALQGRWPGAGRHHERAGRPDLRPDHADRARHQGRPACPGAWAWSACPT